MPATLTTTTSTTLQKTDASTAMTDSTVLPSKHVPLSRRMHHTSNTLRRIQKLVIIYLIWTSRLIKLQGNEAARTAALKFTSHGFVESRKDLPDSLTNLSVQSRFTDAYKPTHTTTQHITQHVPL